VLLLNIMMLTPVILTQASTMQNVSEISPRTTVRVYQYSLVFADYSSAVAGIAVGQINGVNVTANIISTQGNFVQVYIMGDPYFNGSTKWIKNSHLY